MTNRELAILGLNDLVEVNIGRNSALVVGVALGLEYGAVEGEVAAGEAEELGGCGDALDAEEEGEGGAEGGTHFGWLSGLCGKS